MLFPISDCPSVPNLGGDDAGVHAGVFHVESANLESAVRMEGEPLVVVVVLGQQTTSQRLLLSE